MKHVFFISDRTGITTESLGSALLTQFKQIPIKKHFFPFIDTEHKTQAVILKIHNQFIDSGERPIIFTSIMNPLIRDKFNLDYVCHIDFFEAFIPTLEQEFNHPASQAVGMFHGMIDEEKYYKRMDAIDFALHNDDGATTKNYESADVILMGVSRVGKTPTCLYLAVNYGIKAANYPLTDTDLQQEKLPKSLAAYQDKLFGLTIELERLHHIRSHRMPGSQYADLKTCRTEISAAENIMHHHNIASLNTSKKSVEEIAIAIMQHISLAR